MNKAMLLITKTLIIISFLSFNAFGQTKSYSIKRAEIKTPNGYRGKVYEPNSLFLIINESSKVITILNAPDNQTLNFKILEISLDFQKTKTLHKKYYLCSLGDLGKLDVVVVLNPIEKIITMKNLEGKIEVYTYHY
jgi:hypothetical protein